MDRLRTVSSLILVGWFTWNQPSLVSAEPYRPQQDEQVLERLSVKRADPVTRQLSLLRATLSRQPENLDAAVSLATRLIELARSDGDPRFLGQAQAILATWWNEPSAPPAVLLLRATVRQNTHEFDRALADLETVLSRQPTNPQAWLTKASVLQVQGQYEDARRACQRLFRLASRHVSLTCVSDIAGLTGHVDESREQLAAILERPGISLRDRLWILTVLAEMAARTGDAQQAEQRFHEALGLGVKDQYLLSAYADFLLDQGRAQEVISLLRQDTKADGLLLRLTLAEQALHSPTAKDHAAELAARFAAGRARGSSVHVREEVRFTLALLQDPQKALMLAQDNWKVQKEPWDARLLLESAWATGRKDAANPVLDWLTKNHVQDLRLQQLASRFSEGQP